MSESAASFVEDENAGKQSPEEGGDTAESAEAAEAADTERDESTETPEVEDEGSDAEDGSDDEVPEDAATLVARLEREGDIAADYLEELLDIADVDGDIDLDVEGERAMVAIVGGDLGRLVGPEGEVLEALQELTRLAVYRETGMRSRLMLDVAGFRARRRSELVALAEKIAEEVRASGEPTKLDPMTPFERKIIHDTVAAKGLTSESEGEEPDRRVVVQPA